MKCSKSISNTPDKAKNSAKSGSDSPVRRFEKSMKIDYEKWHDGVGYDLEALKSTTPDQLKTIEQILINHCPRDWRDIEALAQIDTITARETVKNALKDPNVDIQIAVTRFAPNLLTKTERSHTLIRALETAEIFNGLSQVLDQIEGYHPKEIIEALMEGLLNREGEVQSSLLECSFTYMQKHLLFLTGVSDLSFFGLTPRIKMTEGRHS